jgi:hypothetical protein
MHMEAELDPSTTMARRQISIEDKQRWMRERQAGATLVAGPVTVVTEHHYSVADIAEMWGLSHDAVRKIFHNEAGVLVLGGLGSTHRRRYTTLRIPASVLERVHRRMSNV